MKSPHFPFKSWGGLLATIIIVVSVRELALVICTALGMPTAANIVGLVGLFLVLISIRMQKGNIPDWLSTSAGTLLVDSGFAFLPVSAGAGILLFGLGTELTAVSIIIIVSVIIPLWLFAKLSEYWLNKDSKHTDNP